MDYLIVFLEGIITFISPCILPMIPLYAAYFAGKPDDNTRSNMRALMNAIGFVIGFTIIFTLMGTAAGSFGKEMRAHIKLITRLSGVLLILFGLNYMELINISALQTTKRIKTTIMPFKFLSSVLFGFVFAFGWTPCIGTFLGSALMLAAHSADSMKGTVMLLCYSAGLGVPFIASALLINQLKEAFGFIKNHYKVINYISGFILILIGTAMILGYFNTILSFFTFV